LQLPISAVKAHRHLKHSTATVGQTQGLDSMAAMGIGFVAGWGSCRVDVVAIDAWFLDVLDVAELERVCIL
jgi:hypothetical protein